MKHFILLTALFFQTGCSHTESANLNIIRCPYTVGVYNLDGEIVYTITGRRVSLEALKQRLSLLRAYRTSPEAEPYIKFYFSESLTVADVKNFLLVLYEVGFESSILIFDEEITLTAGRIQFDPEAKIMLDHDLFEAMEP